MELMRQTLRAGFPLARNRALRSVPTGFQNTAVAPRTAVDVIAQVKAVTRMMYALVSSPANVASEPGHVTIRDQKVLQELSGGLISHIEMATLQPTEDPRLPRVKVRSGGLVYRFAPTTRKNDAPDKMYRVDDNLGRTVEAIEHPDGTITFTN